MLYICIGLAIKLFLKNKKNDKYSNKKSLFND